MGDIEDDFEYEDEEYEEQSHKQGRNHMVGKDSTQMIEESILNELQNSLGN